MIVHDSASRFIPTASVVYEEGISGHPLACSNQLPQILKIGNFDSGGSSRIVRDAEQPPVLSNRGRRSHSTTIVGRRRSPMVVKDGLMGTAEGVIFLLSINDYFSNCSRIHSPNPDHVTQSHNPRYPNTQPNGSRNLEKTSVIILTIFKFLQKKEISVCGRKPHIWL